MDEHNLRIEEFRARIAEREARLVEVQERLVALMSRIEGRLKPASAYTPSSEVHKDITRLIEQTNAIRDEINFFKGEIRAITHLMTMEEIDSVSSPIFGAAADEHDPHPSRLLRSNAKEVEDEKHTRRP